MGGREKGREEEIKGGRGREIKGEKKMRLEKKKYEAKVVEVEVEVLLYKREKLREKEGNIIIVKNDMAE